MGQGSLNGNDGPRVVGRSAPADRLAAVVAQQVAAEWGVELSERFESSHSFVAAAGEDAVLKIVPPADVETEHAADALAVWDGDHAVRLLRHDRSRKALLLERARPGSDLSEVPEEEAISIAVEVGRHLWRPVPERSPFRDVVELSRGRLADLADVDHELVPRARAILDRIQVRTPRVIHGDLHHHNILRRGDEWVAMDPKPAAGEPEYDVAPFLWNPIGTWPTRERTSRWLSAFAAAGLDPDRMRAWVIVRGTILGFSFRPGRPQHAPQLQVVRSLL